MCLCYVVSILCVMLFCVYLMCLCYVVFILCVYVMFSLKDCYVKYNMVDYIVSCCFVSILCVYIMCVSKLCLRYRLTEDL